MPHQTLLRILLFGFSLQLSAQNTDFAVLPVAGVSGFGTALSRADVALAQSMITPNALRGSIGESVAGTSFLKNTLEQTGNWHNIVPRSGPQGLDHLFIKTNAQGQPLDLLVGETKFNTSKLGHTQDGLQMGSRWIGRRLTPLGTRYLDAAQSRQIIIDKAPLNPNRQISLVLKNGRNVSFWKKSSLDSWRFSGTKGELAEAQKLATGYGHFLQKAGSGAFSYRTRLFQVLPAGDGIKINIYNGKNLDRVTSFAQLGKPMQTQVIPNVMVKNGLLLKNAQQDIARALQQKMPHLNDSEAQQLASQVLNRSPRNLLRPVSFLHTTIATSLLAGGVSALLDGILQYKETGHVISQRVVISGVSTSGGVAAGRIIHAGLLRSPTAWNTLRTISGPLHCSGNVLSSSLSAAGGGAIASALFSYGMWYFGYSDLKTAHRSAIIGIAASGTGALVAAGTMGAIATWGTAGTGTAIASLSGAAATNATLAALGGGTLAAGGGGVALGTTILSGGTIIVVALVTVAGYQIYKKWDEHQMAQSYEQLLAKYCNPAILNKIVENSPYCRQLTESINE